MESTAEALKKKRVNNNIVNNKFINKMRKHLALGYGIKYNVSRFGTSHRMAGDPAAFHAGIPYSKDMDGNDLKQETMYIGMD